MTQIISNNNGGGGGAGAYKYKGSVDYYEDLPTSGMKIGDTYNVVNPFTEGGKDYPAGTNVAWTGTEWDALGGSIDLSDYQKKLVEGNGIDIDQDTNEISVESSVISGAELGATAIQPLDNVSELTNDAGYVDKDVNDLTNYTQTCDLGCVALTNKYCDLDDKPTIGNGKLTICRNGSCLIDYCANQTSNSGVNIEVPTCTSQLCNDSGYIDKTVNDLDNYTKSSELCNVATSGKYCDLTGTPNLCSVATSGKYCDLTGTPNLCTVATSGKYCDLTGLPTIPTDNCQLANGCGYTTCTGTLVPSDLTPYAKNCDLCTVAKSGKYCDLTGQPTIPTIIDSLNSSCTGEALSAKQGCVLNSCVTAINDKIPSAATCSNQLADKAFVNSSINSMAAFYITKDAQGDQFDTYAELAAATVFYSGGVVRTPTQNDYTIVASDETHDNATTRYVYQGSQWEYQYTVNETALTQAQLDAINSGITAAKVSAYDCYASTKQDVACMVCDLTGADNNHYPTAKAVADALSGAGAGDMLKSTYDPNNCNSDAFNYCNFYNTPDLCTVATSGKYCDLTGQPTIPTNNNQLTNGCGYTTCTGTLVAGDLAPYAKTCDLSDVATSGKYCDLTGTPSLCAVATSGKYCDLTGQPTIGNATLSICRNCVPVNSFTANATSNVSVNIEVPTDTCELSNNAGFITASDLVEGCGICISGCTISNAGVTSVNGNTGDVTAVGSSNCTYDNIIHLSQSDYDNLGTYDPDTLYSTPEGDMEGLVDNTAYGASWDGVTDKAPSMNAVYDKVNCIDADVCCKITCPTGGSNGQFLQKTSTGAEWCGVCQVPTGGSCGQVLTKNSSGYGWSTPSAGGVNVTCITSLTQGYRTSTFNLKEYKLLLIDNMWGSAVLATDNSLSRNGGNMMCRYLTGCSCSQMPFYLCTTCSADKFASIKFCSSDYYLGTVRVYGIK